MGHDAKPAIDSAYRAIAGQFWYYRSLVQAPVSPKASPLVAELARTVRDLRKLAQRS